MVELGYDVVPTALFRLADAAALVEAVASVPEVLFPTTTR